MPPTIPACFPWVSLSRVTLGRGSKETEAQVIDPRQLIQGKRFGSGLLFHVMPSPLTYLLFHVSKSEKWWIWVETHWYKYWKDGEPAKSMKNPPPQSMQISPKKLTQLAHLLPISQNTRELLVNSEFNKNPELSKMYSHHHVYEAHSQRGKRGKTIISFCLSLNAKLKD